MKLDLHHVLIQPCSYDLKVSIDKSYYGTTKIVDISDIDLSFAISRNLSQEDILFLKARGELYLVDAKTLQVVSYPFQVEFEEKIDENNDFFAKNLENSKNTLDIIEILWENIVLEIPISYSTSEEALKPDTLDGWTVAKEGEKKEEVDPRLAPLLGLLDKEKE